MTFQEQVLLPQNFTWKGDIHDDSDWPDWFKKLVISGKVYSTWEKFPVLLIRNSAKEFFVGDNMEEKDFEFPK